MAKNRMLFYGYTMKNGKIEALPQEQEVINEIFTRYASGASYKTIAEHLTMQGIPYLPNKLSWSKNLVARILRNAAYLGDEKYPPLVENELFEKAQQAMKPYTYSADARIKLLKPLLHCACCGASLGRRVKNNKEERWFCPNEPKHISARLRDEDILNGLDVLLRQKDEPELSVDATIRVESPELLLLLSEIDRAFRAEEADIQSTTAKIKRLAELRYLHCDEVCATAPLIDRYTEKGIEILIPWIDAIHLQECWLVSVTFKLGQTIQNEVKQDE